MKPQHRSKLFSRTIVMHSGSQRCWVKLSSSASNPVTVCLEALAWAYVCWLQPTDKCHNAILSIVMINSYMQHIPGLNKWTTLHKCVRSHETWKQRVYKSRQRVWPKTEHWQVLFGIWSHFKQTDCRRVSLFALRVKRGCLESQEVFARHSIGSCSRHVCTHTWIMGEGNYRQQRSGEWHLATIRGNVLAKESHYHLLFLMSYFCPIVWKITPSLFVSLQHAFAGPSSQDFCWIKNDNEKGPSQLATCIS